MLNTEININNKLLNIIKSLFIVFILGIFLSAYSIHTYSQPSQDVAKKTESSLLHEIARLENNQREKIEEIIFQNQHLLSDHFYNITMRLASLTYYFDADKAIRYYQAGLEIALLLKKDELVASAHYSLSGAYSGQYKIEEAVRSLVDSQRYYQKIANNEGIVRTLADQASLYLYKNDHKIAKKYAIETLILTDSIISDRRRPEDYGIAVAYSVIAYLNSLEGQYSQSLEFYQKSLALFQRLDEGSFIYTLNMTEILSGLGRVHYQIGNNTEALSYFEKAYIYAKKTLRKDRVAGVLNDMGSLFLEQEDYEVALNYFDQSFRIYQSTSLNHETTRLEYNIGLTRYRMGDTDKAFHIFLSCKKSGIDGNYPDIIIVAGEGLSTIYRKKGEYTRAFQELELSERHAIAINERDRIAEIIWLRSRIHQDLHNYQEAIRMANLAILQAKDINDHKTYYLASTTLGECYLALKNYELAYQHLMQAIQILEKMRHRIIGQEYEKQLFFEQKTAAYHAMIELLVSQNKPLEALKFADKTKARTLNETMSQGIIERGSGVPSVLRREEKRVNLQIMEISQQLREESLKSQPSIANINKLTEQIASTRKTYLDLQSNSTILRPEFKDEFMSGESTISPGLKKALSKSPMTILEYVVREDGVYLFAISKSAHDTDISIKRYKINITKKELKEKVSDFHDLISKRSVSFMALSRDLYDLLIKPAENDLKNKTAICFVPDDILWNFPFQAAQGSDNRFLLEQYSIYYAPSLSTLSMLSEDIRPNGSHKNLSFLSYANPPVASKDSLIRGNSRRNAVFAPLPEAEVEVNKISRLFSKGHSRALVGEKAVESSFKTLASEYKNIHLATHGVLNNQNPMNSYLLFSDVGDEKNDSLLEAREIANLDLDADMVVLSSCETARGSIRRGEGVVGMAWAFLSAGARSTVVSQWKVDSTATASLMVDFYGNMFRNKARTRMTRSESLRQAALKLMKDNRYRHPFYWAGFIVIGNNN